MSLNYKGTLSLDGSAWESGLRKADDSTRKFATGTLMQVKSAIAQAFTVGMAIKALNIIVQHVGKVKDAAEELSVSTDDLQGFQHILTKNNATIEDGIKALNELEKARKAALQDPTGKEAQAFQFFGIDQSSLISKTRLELRDMISDAMQQGTRSGTELVNLTELIGKSASKLRPAFAEGFGEAVDKAREAKQLIESIDIKRIDREAKRIEALKSRTIGTGANMLSTAIDRPILSHVMMSLGGTAALPLMKHISSLPTKAEKAAELAEEVALKAQAEVDAAANAEEVRRAALQSHENHQRRISDINARADEINEKTRTAQLTKEQQLNEALQRRLVILNLINGMRLMSATPGGLGLQEALAKLRVDQAENESTIASLNPTAQKANTRPNPGSDGLVRVGNFLGANGQATVVAVQQKQLHHLSNIDKTLERWLKAVHRGYDGRNTFSMEGLDSHVL